MKFGQEILRTENTGITLLKRRGHPRDIANAILFLASEAASYIKGENI
jgi:NAD(P)-dependent dehydrogenase (short-subunit alcohol dehydrogenase family)